MLIRLVALKPRQADLLARIVDGPTIDSDTLRAAGSLGEASAEAQDADRDEAEREEAQVWAFLGLDSLIQQSASEATG